MNKNPVKRKAEVFCFKQQNRDSTSEENCLLHLQQKQKRWD